MLWSSPLIFQLKMIILDNKKTHMVMKDAARLLIKARKKKLFSA